MKKMMAIILTMVAAFCLSACNQEEQKGNLTEEDHYISFDQATKTEVVENTKAAMPTDEEIEQLRNYVFISNYLKSLNTDTNYLDRQDVLKEEYDKLMAFDYSVIDRWKNTEYATADVLQVGDKDDVIDWDYEALLARFFVVSDVKLLILRTTKDRMGNTECSGEIYDPDWHYYEDGTVAYTEAYYFEEIEPITHRIDRDNFYNYGNKSSYVYDDNGRLSEIKYYDQYEKIDRIRTFIYNEVGKIVQENVKSNYSEFDYYYTYNSDGRLEKISWDGHDSLLDNIEMIYHFDEHGRVVKKEKFQYDYYLGTIDEKYMIEYTYDSDGNKVAATYTAQEWTSTMGGDNNHPYTEKIDQYTYTYDQQGRLLTATVVFGTQYYCDEKRNGQEISKPQFAEAVYEIIYGDYYFYQPMEMKEQ